MSNVDPLTEDRTNEDVLSSVKLAACWKRARPVMNFLDNARLSLNCSINDTIELNESTLAGTYPSFL
jgi:hypothetical protein